MNPDERARLLAMAREAIGREIAGLPPASDTDDDFPPALLPPAAVFVTLMRKGMLRGCVGELEPRLPLALAVMEEARAAAFRDTRFDAVAAVELSLIHIGIAVLSPLEELRFTDEEALLAQIVRGVHGLYLVQGAHRATFLPKVWEHVAEPRRFLALLKQKAGLSPAISLKDAQTWRYTTEEFDEESGSEKRRAPVEAQVDESGPRT